MQRARYQDDTKKFVKLVQQMTPSHQRDNFIQRRAKDKDTNLKDAEVLCGLFSDADKRDGAYLALIRRHPDVEQAQKIVNKLPKDSDSYQAGLRMLIEKQSDLTKAQQILKKITDDYYHDSALVHLIEKYAKSGDITKAQQLTKKIRQNEERDFTFLKLSTEQRDATKAQRLIHSISDTKIRQHALQLLSTR